MFAGRVRQTTAGVHLRKQGGPKARGRTPGAVVRIRRARRNPGQRQQRCVFRDKLQARDEHQQRPDHVMPVGRQPRIF